MATRDRRSSLLHTLERLSALPERPPVAVVDNGSADRSPDAVRAAFPDVLVLEAGHNLGAAARAVGARALGTDLVAFSDDDSWWAPGALARAAEHFAASPRLALLAARILVGDERRLDPTCARMAASPLGVVEGVGPRVLGFVACGAVVRREPFLAAGGFHPRLQLYGEEALLAVDLASAGWELAYAADVVAHHHPTPAHPRPGRHMLEVRNRLWATWLRRPWRRALGETGAAVAGAGRDREAWRALAEAASGAAWVARERRVIPDPVERAVRRLEAERL
ncbi:MAG TPA: glycosyltransferase [Capillimicrobium sp.]|nr:glycosyltransferase [Capillimicrobium sp.]